VRHRLLSSRFSAFQENVNGNPYPYASTNKQTRFKQQMKFSRWLISPSLQQQIWKMVCIKTLLLTWFKWYNGGSVLRIFAGCRSKPQTSNDEDISQRLYQMLLQIENNGLTLFPKK